MKHIQIRNSDMAWHIAANNLVWGGDQFWTESEQPGRTCKP